MSTTACAEYHVHQRRNTTTPDQHIEYMLLTVAMEQSHCRHRCDGITESSYISKSALNIHYAQFACSTLLFNIIMVMIDLSLYA